MEEEFLTLGSALPSGFAMGPALALAGAIAFLGTFVAMPRILGKLRGAGIVGRDVNKPGRPEVPEMGGVGVFLGFNTGVFVFLLLHPVPVEQQILILVSLITAAGAAMTGILDDLIELRQRFKAFIPIVFAAPIAVYVSDYAIVLPLVGPVDFGLAYPFLLVPLGIACAANGLNMLEGYNGLGTGLGFITTLAMAILVTLSGHPEALILLVPLGAALLAFLYYNWHPARAFPGDTLTLFVGAVLAAAAMIGKVEFWGALLFIPHVLEFVVKARNGFPTRGWSGEYREGRLYCPDHGPVGLAQWVMKRAGGLREPHLVLAFLVGQVALAALVLGTFVLAG